MNNGIVEHLLIVPGLSRPALKCLTVQRSEPTLLTTRQPEETSNSNGCEDQQKKKKKDLCEAET